MYLVFTDLDGTLLDRDTYSWQAACPAIGLLRRRSIPWVLVTSKTRAEVELWRRRLDHSHPFVVENGGAAFVPSGYFPNKMSGSTRRGAYEAIEWGAPYEDLVADLRDASRESRCRVRGFHEMTVQEVAVACDLSIQQALLAKKRQYDEPFLVMDPDRADALSRAIEDRNRNWTRGDRFWHITGDNDKAIAVEALAARYELGTSPIRTIGLGDGLNDVSFLNAVTIPVIVRSPSATEMKALAPNALVTDGAGPVGWNEAILAIVGADVQSAYR